MTKAQTALQLKEKLIQNYPNCWVYTFNSKQIRENLLTPVRMLSQADEAIKEAWGFKTENEDIEKMNSILEELKTKAKEIIDFAYSNAGSKVDFKISSLELQSVYDKQKALKPISDIIIPKDSFNILYETAIVVDKFDLPIKEMPIGANWVELIVNYSKLLKEKQDFVMKEILAKKFKARDLSNHKALRKIVGKIKENKTN